MEGWWSSGCRGGVKELGGGGLFPIQLTSRGRRRSAPSRRGPFRYDQRGAHLWFNESEAHVSPCLRVPHLVESSSVPHRGYVLLLPSSHRGVELSMDLGVVRELLIIEVESSSTSPLGDGESPSTSKSSRARAHERPNSPRFTMCEGNKLPRTPCESVEPS